MGKIKNIIVLNDFGTINGGASQIAFQEMTALKDRGFNIFFFCGVGPVDQKIEEKNINIHCLFQQDILNASRITGFFRGLWNVKARNRLKALLRNFSTDDTVIHIHGWSKCLSPSVLRVGEKMGFRTFLTLHDFFLYCPNGGLMDYRKNHICSLKPMSWKCFSCNCDSRSISHKYWRFLRQLLQDYEFAKNKNVTYISISKLSNDLFKRFRPDLVNKLIRIDNPINNKNINRSIKESYIKNRYLFIGRLSEEKGIRLFLEAVKETGVEAEVWGDGYLYEELRVKYPKVVFRGWLDGPQKAKFLPSIKALVFPSVWYETFGLVVAEMLAQGIPCIVGDKTAANELIKDGKSGFLFKIGNKESLKEAILRMEEEYEKLNPLQYFYPENYSIQKHIDKLVSIYNGIKYSRHSKYSDSI